MEYNTLRGNIGYIEYGRNIKKLVDYTLTIEDRAKRTSFAKGIIAVMAQVSPQAKDMIDYQHKLWDHLYVISDFRLDVDCPYPVPKREEVQTMHPQRLSYNGNPIRYRHYGRNMERIIAKVISYPEGEEKEALIEMIAHNLKKSYLKWNRDSVNDELIYEQFNEMTNGELKLNDDFKLLHTREYLSKNVRPKNTPTKSFRSFQPSKNTKSSKTLASGNSSNTSYSSKPNNGQQNPNRAKNSSPTPNQHTRNATNAPSQQKDNKRNKNMKRNNTIKKKEKPRESGE